jgi:hypothetical protein
LRSRLAEWESCSQPLQSSPPDVPR